MATVIYNHREMEYKCRKFWQERYHKEPDFHLLFPRNDRRFQAIRDKMKEINAYAFDEEYAMDYGLDTLRMYVLFEDYPRDENDWREGSLEGIYKFLNRFMTLVENSVSGTIGIAHNQKKSLRHLENKEADICLGEQIEEKTVAFRREYLAALERNHFHGIVAAFMEYSTNLAQIMKKNEICLPQSVLQEVMILLAPYAPYLCEHLWQLLGTQDSVFEQDNAVICMKEASSSCNVDVAIQINGKTKKIITLPIEMTQEQAAASVEQAMKSNMPEQIERIIYVPGKVYNMLVK